MKKLEFLLILIIAGLTFSAQFKVVKDVYEDAGSITAQQCVVKVAVLVKVSLCVRAEKENFIYFEGRDNDFFNF